MLWVRMENWHSSSLCRGGQSKPVKRVVHPKVVHSSASSVSDDGFNKNNNMETDGGGRVGNVESITAAVAASAAVAATQPFLKVLTGS